MTPRDRVMTTLRGERADRVPLNVFAGWNPGARERVNRKYGHVDDFCRRHHVDLVTAFLPRFPFGRPEEHPSQPTLDDFLAMEPIDPTSPALLDMHCDGDLFLSVNEALEYRKHGLPVLVNVWGILESYQFLFEQDGRPGTEQALLNMLVEREKTEAIFHRLAAWGAAAAENAIRAGADILEVSDDWGQQHTMMFNPELWWELIYPTEKIIIDVARKHDVPVILHSDGDITLVLDGVKKLGVSGLHPVQESAGMSFARTREILGDGVCIMGGLDTVTALPVMSPDQIREEVKRVFGLLKESGPFIFAGSHMFQDDAPLPVIEAAYETAYDLSSFG